MATVRTSDGSGRKPPGPILLGTLFAVLIAMWVVPSLASRPRSTSEPVVYDPAPFGTPLAGAIAYLGRDRTFNLVELESGEIVGSKGISGARRPAAASGDRAYLGSLPAVGPDANWDNYRSLPWEATEYRDDASGVSVAYSEDLDIVAAAMRPLPDGSNGVMMSRWDSRFVAASSSGHWSFATWVGDWVLVRELSADQANWWLLDPHGLAEKRAIELPDEFLPIVGTEGLVMGQLGDEGFVGYLATGATVPLEGPFSWAADWTSDPEPLVATVGGDPPGLFVYRPDGSVAWSVLLDPPVTRFGGGISWSPDGEFLVVVAGETFLAYGRDGELLGELSTGAPPPQVSEGAGFVTIVRW